MILDYCSAMEQLVLEPAADRRVRQAMEAALRRRQSRPAKKRLPALALAAVLTAALLAGTALAAWVLDCSEIGPMLRLWANLEADAAPQTLSYDRVTTAADASVADVEHIGAGELYVTVRQTVQSENLLVVDVLVRTVTPEQAETYVWRARTPDGTAYYPGTVQDYAESTGTLSLRFILERQEDWPETLGLTLCGGTESEAKTALDVSRLGTTSVSSLNPRLWVSVCWASGLPMELPGGAVVTIESAEVYENRLLLCLRAEGVYEQYQRALSDGAAQQALTGLANQLTAAMGESGLEFSDGSFYPLLPSAEVFTPGDIWLQGTELPASLDLSTVQSIRIAGQSYELTPAQ